MARLYRLEREQLPENEQPFFDAIGKTRGDISGPFTALIHSADLASRVADVGAYVRFESILPVAVRTFAAIITSRWLDCRYEWGAWSGQARSAGVSDAIIDAVRDRKPLPSLTEEEHIIADFCQQLCSGNHHISDATYKATVDHFGVKGTVELAATVGYFAMIAMPLNAFEVDPNPEGQALQI